MGEEPRTSEDLTEENVTIRQGQGKPEVTTFGPFSAFKNFPSFPDGVLENQQDQLLELRGPNLLPTKPTPPPSSRRPPPKESQRPPVVPSSPDPNEFIFLPSPPLREREPAISVFLDDNDRAPAPQRTGGSKVGKIFGDRHFQKFYAVRSLSFPP